MKRQIAFITLAATLLTPPQMSGAQEPSGRFARVVVIHPKPGHASEFVAGYKQHLQWHRRNKEPWTWYGWAFVLGERDGQFLDGTFGHVLSEFDHSVNPAGDAADNETNVTPHADFVSHGIYERLEFASAGSMLPDNSPYMTINTYIVTPGQESAFESAMRDYAKHSRQKPVSLYKLRVGGPIAQYMLIRPAPSFSAGGLMEDVAVPPGSVQHAKSELLVFQPQMSYSPGE